MWPPIKPERESGGRRSMHVEVVLTSTREGRQERRYNSPDDWAPAMSPVASRLLCWQGDESGVVYECGKNMRLRFCWRDVSWTSRCQRIRRGRERPRSRPRRGPMHASRGKNGARLLNVKKWIFYGAFRHQTDFNHTFYVINVCIKQALISKYWRNIVAIHYSTILPTPPLKS